jgi:hypothetical protein
MIKMANLEQFMERFGHHLLASGRDFKGITSAGLENMAKSLQEDRDNEPTPEEKKRMSPQEQRKYQDTRERATLAWLWAANSCATWIDEPKKFHVFLKNAADEFVWEDFYSEGELLAHFQETAEILNFALDEANRQAVYGAIKEYSQMPRFDPLKVGIVPYGEKTHKLLLDHSVGLLKQKEYWDEIVKSSGTKMEELDQDKAEIEGKKTAIDKEIESLGRTRIIRKMQLRKERQTITMQSTELQKKIKAYNPMDDIRVYDSTNGRVCFLIGSFDVKFFDMIGVGNRMAYEAMRWQALQDKTQGANFEIFDVAIKTMDVLAAKRENAEYGTYPVAFDSDRKTWGFSEPYSTRKGFYRRNAAGLVVTEL